MKCWRNFLALVLAAGFVIVLVDSGVGRAQGMMGGRRGMMGGQDMREMMQQMMGDMLPPPMDPAFLPDPDSEGARLLQRFCAQCHYLPGPGLHTSAEWPPVVERMNRRMQMMSRPGMMMGRIEAPTEQELAAIRGYLQAHAQKPLPTRLMPDLESEAGKAFRATCSQCHVLPDPGQHTAKEWPAVVERMKGYMASMGKSVPDEKTASEIVGFLQRYGRPDDQTGARATSKFAGPALGSRKGRRRWERRSLARIEASAHRSPFRSRLEEALEIVRQLRA